MAYGAILGLETGGASGGASSTDIENHNNSATAHPSILEKISAIEDRVLAVEIAGGAEVTSNLFVVTMGSLDGITTDGIWNSTEKRLEF